MVAISPPPERPSASGHLGLARNAAAAVDNAAACASSASAQQSGVGQMPSIARANRGAASLDCQPARIWPSRSCMVPISAPSEVPTSETPAPACAIRCGVDGQFAHLRLPHSVPPTAMPDGRSTIRLARSEDSTRRSAPDVEGNGPCGTNRGSVSAPFQFGHRRRVTADFRWSRRATGHFVVGPDTYARVTCEPMHDVGGHPTDQAGR